MNVTTTRWRFDIESYHLLHDQDVFGRDARTELIDGQVFVMSPIGNRHAGCVRALTAVLTEALDGRGVLSVQNSLLLDNLTELQPDVVILRPGPEDDRFYRTSTPTPGDCIAVIEVAETSLRHDRLAKRPRYARAGVRELWIVNLAKERVEVHRSPEGTVYSDIASLGRGEVLTLGPIEGFGISVDDVLGP